MKTFLLVVSFLFLILLSYYGLIVIGFGFYNSVNEGLKVIAVFGIPVFLLWILWLRQIIKG